MLSRCEHVGQKGRDGAVKNVIRTWSFGGRNIILKSNLENKHYKFSNLINNLFP